MMKQNINVLHLIDSGGLYGAENVILSLSDSLRKKGHRSIVGCLTYKGKPYPEFGMKAMELGFNTAFFEMKNKIDLKCTKKVAKYCKVNNVQIIHSHGYKPTLVCLLLNLFYRIQYVVTCHLWYSHNLKLKIYAFLEYLCMLKAKAVIGVSQDIVNDLRKGALKVRNIFLIENGIDVEAVSEAAISSDIELRDKLSLQKSSFIIGSLGRLTEQKDYKTFVKAASEVLKEQKDIEFIVAGEGNLKNKLISLTKKLKIDNRFHFVGFQKDIPSLLHLMDVFVLSSLDEGLPIALLEAMAANCPVVTTAVGAIPSIINDGVNGMIFQKQDFVHLKEICLYLKSDSQLRKILSANAYNLVSSQFSNNQMTRKYLELYDHILSH